MKQYIIAAARLFACCRCCLLSLTIFLFVRVTGDPTTLLVEPGASEADIAAMHQQFGLDQPLWVQYGLFMVSLAARRFRPVVLLPHAGARPLPRRGCRTRCCWPRWRWRSRC